jgi:galactose-1-phosphate uridylyltransferase
VPAKSKAQQRLMAGCLHSPEHMKNCPDMTDDQLRDFASTKTKGLPKLTKLKKLKRKVKYPNPN